MADAARQLEERLGPNPHAQRGGALAVAYAAGLGAVLPQILGNPWLPSKILRSLALRRFRAIVRHAKETAPFYAEHFAALDPASVRDERDLDRVPALTKALLRENASRLRSSHAPDERLLLERQSSGSSGSPVKIHFDPMKELPRRLQELRLLTAHGYKPWDLQLIFDNPTHVPKEKMFPQKLGLLRREMFPIFASAEEAVAEVDRRRPEILHGVLSGIRMLAIALRRFGPLSFRPKLVVTKGELLDPLSRSLIESAFGAKVADYYATEETGIIAWECPSGSGYHVDTDLVYLEIVDEAGRAVPPGTPGEICLTNLYMRAMPIIRYRVGDVGVLSPDPCPCGRGLPVLKKLEGRKLDVIVTPEREVHHPFGLIAKLEDCEGLEMFRLVQPSVDRLEVHVKWEPAMRLSKEEAARAVLQNLRDRLGPSIAIDVVEIGDLKQHFAQKFPLVKGLGLSAEAIADGGYAFRF